MFPLRAIDTLSHELPVVPANRGPADVFGGEVSVDSTHVAVFDEGRFCGLVSVKELADCPPGVAFRDLAARETTLRLAAHTPIEEVCLAMFRDGKDAAAIIDDADGSYVGVVTADRLRRLLSEHDRTENSISSRFGQRGFEKVGEPILWIAPNADLRIVNDAACRLLGYGREELLAKSFFDLDLNCSPAKFADSWNELRQKKFITTESTVLSKDGRTIAAELTVSYLELDGQEFGCSVFRDLSARNRDQEHALENERRFVEAQSIGHLGYWEWNIQTGRNHWSDENYRVHGFAPRSVIPSYEVWIGTIHPGDRQRVVERVSAALAGTLPFDLDYRVIQPGGRVIEVYVQGEVFRDTDGQPIRMAGVVQNITERNDLQQRLVEREERLRYGIDATGDGLCDHNMLTGDCYYSPRWCQILGFASREVPARHEFFLSRIHPEDVARFRSALEAHLAGRTPNKQCEIRLKTKSGDYIWVHDRGKIVVWDEHGAPGRMVGAITDISERKRVENSLRLTQFCMDRASDCIFWINADSTIFYLNDSACRVLGYTLEELLGKPISAIDPNFPDELWPAHWNRIKQSGSLTFETKNRTKDGRTIEVEVVCNFIEHDGCEYVCAMWRDITDRNRAAGTNARNRQLFEAILNGTPDAVYAKDTEGRYLLINTAGAAYVGKSRSDFERRDDTAIFPAAQANVIMELDRRIRQDRRMMAFEELVESSNGRQIVFHSVKGPLLSDEGEPWGTFGISRDITELKESEKRTREALLYYRTIFEQAGVGVAQIDSQTGRFLRVNRKYCEIVGLTETEMLATDFMALTHSDDLQQDLDCMKRLIAGEITQFSLEKRYVKSGGRIAWVNLTVSPLWAPGEAPMSHMAVAKEITDRKSAEEKLIRSERDYRGLFDSAHDAILVFRPDDEVIIDVNQRACEIYGYSRGEFIGMSLETISENVSRGKKQIEETLKIGTKLNFESVQYRKSGEAMCIEINASVIDYHGQLAILSINRDITERNALKKELELRRAEVAHASRLSFVGGMASGLAHELNQPLTAIQTYAACGLERIASGCAAPRLQDDLEKIKRQVERAGAVIRNIRNFVRRQDLHRSTININHVIQNSIAFIRNEFEHRGINVTLRLQEPLPHVVVDQVQIGQVVLNLVQNAIEAMAGANIKSPEVTLETSYDPEGFIQVAVSDRGPGLPRELRTKLFTPFFTTKRDGLGLGLSICKSIIESHNGSIAADDNVPQGLTIRFLLPAQETMP